MWPSIQSTLETIPFTIEKNVHSIIIGYFMEDCQILLLHILSTSPIFLCMFCLVLFSIIKCEALQFLFFFFNCLFLPSILSAFASCLYFNFFLLSFAQSKLLPLTSFSCSLNLLYISDVEPLDWKCHSHYCGFKLQDLYLLPVYSVYIFIGILYLTRHSHSLLHCLVPLQPPCPSRNLWKFFKVLRISHSLVLPLKFFSRPVIISIGIIASGSCHLNKGCWLF